MSNEPTDRIHAPGPSPFVVLVMNLFVYPLTIFWTALGSLFFPLVVLLCKLFTRWSLDRIMRFIIWGYGRGWLWIVAPFVRFRREQFENLPSDGPCLFVTNHFSFFDTYFMAGLPIHDIIFTIRAWPFKMPWFRPFMKMARYMNIESMDWGQTAEACKLEFERRHNILFYPEGHRSRDGKVGRFYSGAFKIAIDSGVPLVPLCIVGTGEFLPPKRLCMHPATVRLRVLPAIDTTAYKGELGHVELRKAVKAAIVENLAQMRSMDDHV